MALSRAAIILLMPLCALPMSGTANAAPMSTPATIGIHCTGPREARVAIRWGHSDHDQNEYMAPPAPPPPAKLPPGPYLVTKCNLADSTTTFQLDSANSEFEIQTEGGKETAYVVTVSVKGQAAGTVNSIQLVHEGSQDFIVRDPRVTLKRSSGPNQYGEQNFRVVLPPGGASEVKMLALVTGTSKARMALRWGHPDFNDKKYFDMWTVRPPGDTIPHFAIPDVKSEFEIQTEGGTATGYHLSAWLTIGSTPTGALPTFEVYHEGAPTIVPIDVTFKPTGGNVYGERNVRVTAKWLPSGAGVPPGTTGLGSLSFSYNYGIVPYTQIQPAPVQIRYHGDDTQPTGANGSQTFDSMTPDNKITVGSPGGGGGYNQFLYPAQGPLPGLRPGRWTISARLLPDGTLVTCPNVQIVADSVTTLHIDRVKRSCY